MCHINMLLTHEKKECNKIKLQCIFYINLKKILKYIINPYWLLPALSQRIAIIILQKNFSINFIVNPISIIKFSNKTLLNSDIILILKILVNKSRLKCHIFGFYCLNWNDSFSNSPNNLRKFWNFLSYF
jgi:hypothetical protein